MEIQQQNTNHNCADYLNQKCNNIDMNPPPCPFSFSNHFFPSKTREFEIRRKIICQCGKQVGEAIHSSDQLIGHWIVYPFSQGQTQEFQQKTIMWTRQISKNIIFNVNRMKTLEREMMEIKKQMDQEDRKPTNESVERNTEGYIRKDSRERPKRSRSRQSEKNHKKNEQTPMEIQKTKSKEIPMEIQGEDKRQL